MMSPLAAFFVSVTEQALWLGSVDEIKNDKQLCCVHHLAC